MSKKSTMVELVDELRKLQQTPSMQIIIEEALAGEYHDFKNRKYVCGKVELSRRLRQLEYVALAQRVERGEFDEEMDEEDRRKMRAELGDDPRMNELLGL